MSGFTIVSAAEVPDVLGDYPGEMRMFAGPLAAEQVALTHRTMPPKSGGKGSYGHRHKTQEELYLVLSGTLQFKLEDEVMEVGPMHAVRVAPEVVRSVWNEGPDDAELVICSVRSTDPEGDAELVPDFWPDE